ncbi:MAG: ANTAR domain-containing protein [bacterium]|jgi:GAF domain-containing protein
MSTESPALELAYRVSAIVSSSAALDRIVSQVICLVAKAAACDACVVFQSAAEGGDVTIYASRAPHESEPARVVLAATDCEPAWMAAPPAVLAIERRASGDARFRPVEGFVDAGHEALLSVPLAAGGTALGLVNVHDREPRAYTPAEVAMLTFVGEQLGLAISASLLACEASRLREETLRLQSELETRKLLERAKGIVQRDYGISEEEAYLRLRAESRRTRRRLREIAEAVILADSAARTSRSA